MPEQTGPHKTPPDGTEDLNLTFEQAYAELEQTVTALQQGQPSLEETLRLYERGTRLARYCREKLEAVELKVSQLVSQANGTYTTKPVTTGREPASPPSEPSTPESRPTPEQPAAVQEAEPADDLLREQRELFD